MNPKHIIFNGRVYGLLEEGCYTMKNPVQVVEKTQEPSFQERLRKFVSDQKDCPPEFMRVVNKEFWNLFSDDLKPQEPSLLSSAILLLKESTGMMKLLDRDRKIDAVDDYLDKVSKLLVEYEQRKEKP